MKEKVEPQNKFHSTYLPINLFKDEAETGIMEYISQYLLTHKFTARKQLFIISYELSWKLDFIIWLSLLLLKVRAL